MGERYQPRAPIYLPRRLLEEAGVAVIAETSFKRPGEGHVRFSDAASLAEMADGMGVTGAPPSAWPGRGC